MNLIEQKKHFEATKKIYESTKLVFHGTEEFDVYNTSIPFEWNGKRYIFGRVEKRTEWSRSAVRLFENIGGDEWTLVPYPVFSQLEDPYISIIGELLVLGGVHTRIKQGKVETYNSYFYKGKDINDLYYFTTGPDYMKDIRLVKMLDNSIGVFSRPRNENIRKKYGCESQIGFAIINDLYELSEEVIENATYIEDLFDKDEWGGCNQAYCLDSGFIGVIGHKCYKTTNVKGQVISTYMNISFIFDPAKHKAIDVKVIGTRNCYPEGPSKSPELVDCSFTSGIVMREDGKVDLFSGIGDCEVGRIVIDYPFEGYGKII